MDSVAQDLIPAIMNLLSKKLDSHLDTIDTTNEVIEKVLHHLDVDLLFSHRLDYQRIEN